ncbi:uncharacterized protein LOC134212548 [Armigeres subalbatus]|uniref:uncharacterized protein LOC134212548 n=1 Tax=Armigeres subalbatus TaxID=124917 RepID=UPI002ED10E00
MHFALEFTVGIVLIGVLIHTTSGIKCWECRSDLDPKCSDPFDNTSVPLSDCSRKSLAHLSEVRATLCRKVRQKVNGEWRYIRSCAFIGEPGIGGDERYCLMRSGTFNIFVEYCTCNSKDGCNSALDKVPLSHLLVSSFILCCFITYMIGDFG